MKKQDTVIIIVIIKKGVLLMQEYAKYNAVKNVLRIYGVKNYIIYYTAKSNAICLLCKLAQIS